MKVPTYVWVSGIILFTIAEFRRWIELALSFKNENSDDSSDEEEEVNEPPKLNKEIPKAVQHLYS